MYNIDLKENETIIYNNDDVQVLKDNQIVEVSVVVTNNRLIILQDGNKLGNMNSVLRTTKSVGFVPNREIIFEVSLSNIVKTMPGEYSKIVLNNNTFIQISDENIIHIIETRDWSRHFVYFLNYVIMYFFEKISCAHISSVV